VDQNILGTRTWSFEDYIQRGNNTSAIIWSTDLGRCNEIRVQQTEVHQSAKANEYKNGQSIPHSIKRRLCIVTGTTAIIIKIEVEVKKYSNRIGIGGLTQPADRELERKNWPHPAEVVNISEATEYKKQTIEVYTDGSKNEHGVGSGVAIHVENKPPIQYKNQTEQQVYKQLSGTASYCQSI
jgi:hypothetical protein